MEVNGGIDSGADAVFLGLQRVESLREFAGRFEGPLVLEAYCKYVGAISAVGGRHGCGYCNGDVSRRGALCGASAVRQSDSSGAVGSSDLGSIGGGAVHTKSHSGCLDDSIGDSASLCAEFVAGCDTARVGELDASQQFNDTREGCGFRQDDSISPSLNGRGPNYARNKAARERRRNRGKFAGANDLDKGFWNSCSPAVRQELIDSKARMHIADNYERIRRCDLAAKKDASVETLIREIIRIAELQEKSAKVGNDKVAGWIAGVVSNQVETIASSAPSSVPSFEELSAKLAASSQSSFELSIKAKDDEISAKNCELQEKKNEIIALKNSLRLEREKDDELAAFIDEPLVQRTPLRTGVGNGARVSGVKFGDFAKSKGSRSKYAHVDLATVKPNPMPMTPERLKQWNDNHISLTRAQVYEE